jgi:hypothetical protein
MDGGLENMWVMDSIAHISWLELLYGFPTSPTCFRVFDSCGIWLVAFLCAFLVLMVIAFLIAWSLMSPSWDWMNYLTPFHVGWDEFVNMLIELLCWFMILFLWCFFWFFLCWSLESLSPFCYNNHTRSFLRAYISQHASHGTQWLLLWTKFCISLTRMISWVHLCCIQVLGSQVFID